MNWVDAYPGMPITRDQLFEASRLHDCLGWEPREYGDGFTLYIKSSRGYKPFDFETIGHRAIIHEDPDYISGNSLPLFLAACHYARAYNSLERLSHLLAVETGLYWGEDWQVWRDGLSRCHNLPYAADIILGEWDNCLDAALEFDRSHEIQAEAMPYLPRVPIFKDMLEWASATVHPNRGWVYIIREASEGYYKIGKTKDPDDRLATFEVKLPFMVNFTHLIHTTDRHLLESVIHAAFKDKRVSGEWFNLETWEVDYLVNLDFIHSPEHTAETISHYRKTYREFNPNPR